MSRHTTSITTDPRLRARQRIREALVTLREDARVTGDAFAQFQTEQDREVAYQRAIVAGCDELLTHTDREWAPPPPTSAYDRRSQSPAVGTELGRGVV